MNALNENNLKKLGLYEGLSPVDIKTRNKGKVTLMYPSWVKFSHITWLEN